MPASPRPLSDEHSAVAAAAFDLSDVDEVDISSAGCSVHEPRRTRNRDRADLAEDVLATCALLVFQGRRRKPRFSTGPIALPGL